MICSDDEKVVVDLNVGLFAELCEMDGVIHRLNEVDSKTLKRILDLRTGSMKDSSLAELLEMYRASSYLMLWDVERRALNVLRNKYVRKYTPEELRSMLK